MRIARIALKTLAWITGIVLGLLLLIIVAIQIPSVQNKVLAYAIPTIEDLLGGAEVRIGHINLAFFDAASVEQVYIGDLQGDTLLYANYLKADIGAFSLFGGSIVLDEIKLDGAVVNAYQRADDEAFNYQFIIDAFAPTDTVATDTAAAAFDIGIGTVDVTNTRIRLLDEVARTDLNVRVERLLTHIDELDLENLAIAFEDILVEGVDGSFVIEEFDDVKDAVQGTALDTMASGATVVTFPTAGLPIEIGQLSLKRINLAFSDANVARVAQGLDAGNIGITDLNAEARDFLWDSTQIKLDWESLSFRERSGLVVDQLGFGLAMTDSGLRVSDFEFKTPYSQVLAKAELDYRSFNQLVALDPNTQVSANFDNSYVAFEDIKLLAPTLSEAGINLDAEGSIYLNGSIAGDLNELQLQGVDVRVGRQTAVALSGALINPLDPTGLRYDLKVDRLTSSYADLNRLTRGLELPRELAKFGRFSFSGSVAGTTTTFQGRNLDLRTDGRTGFRGNVSARNLDNPAKLYIDADVRQLRTRMSELRAFVPDSLGVDAMALGDVDFAGRFRGTLTDFALKGKLNTSIGSSTQDIVADFNSDYTDGSYAGTVSLDSFNVGRLLQDSTIGKLSLDLAVDGSGLAVEDVVTTIEGNVRSFSYLGYTYKDFKIDGNLDEQLFEGQFGIDDPNIKMSFDGLVNMRDSLPDLQFTARIDTVALQPLGFSPTKLGLSLAIVSNLRGNTADNLMGSLRIDSLTLNDSVKSVRLERMLVRAGDTSEGRFLVLESPILRAGIIGDYNTADMPVLFTNYVNDFFPIDEYLSPRDKPAELAIEPTPQQVITDQSFRFYVEASRPVRFINFFDPNLRRLDTASFTGTLDTKDKTLTGNFFLPNLNYDGTTVDTIALDIGGDAREMLLALRTANINAGGQKIELALADLRLADDSLRLGISGYLDRDSLLLRTGVSAYMNPAGRYVVRMNDLLEVAGQNWNVDPQNEIEYWANYLRIQDLTFEKDDQYISIASDDESQDSDFAPLTVTIRNYQLSEVSRLVQLTGFTLDGEVNGTLGIRDPAGSMYYVADINVDSLDLNGSDVGNLVINATSEGLDNAVGIDVRLNGTVNDMAIAGEYGISDGGLDIVARIRALEMRLIDPVAQGILSNSTGVMVADMTITGTVEQPNVNGYFGFDDAATTYDLLGIRLGLADNRIKFTESRIDFGNFVVTDVKDRTATLTGGIDHDYFTDFRFGMRLVTDGFKVLGTEPTIDALYYGDAVVSARVDISGDLEIPVVRVVAETLDSTDVFIQPLASTGGVTTEAWVIYANPEEPHADSLLADAYTANALGIDLTMTLTVYENAQLHVIVDPATGDALRAKGRADMAVQMSPDGDLSVTGIYTLSEGSYQFSFAPGGFAVQQRDFTIRPGSNLQFIGDPLDTRFDITAVYTTETTTYELIADELGGDSQSAEAVASQRRQPVNVLMQMRGNIDEPVLTFDIEVPEAGGGVSGAVQTKLAQLRQTPNALYQQVFGLLVLNSFMSSEPGGGSVGGAGTSLAINSVSKLVTDQLNGLADNYLKGVNLNVGLDSYEDQYSSSGRTTTANIDLSKSFLDERLTVTIGTEANVGNGAAGGQAAATGGFQSSFVLTYRLTENGHYLLRAFRRPDYDILSAAGQFETGAGVTYQRKFK